MKMSWLDELKVGDEVVVSGRHSKYIDKITKVMPMSVEVGNRRYRKTDGIERSDDIWDRTHIIECTPERKEAIRNRDRRIRMANHCRGTDWNKLDNERLERIVAILKEAEGEA
jgi:hypothetical protein